MPRYDLDRYHHPTLMGYLCIPWSSILNPISITTLRAN